ncbi:hypothetical protein [Sphingomonas sp. OK281]|uniref:hypothetical protein n=1 Tax=Sphingomonas sp. OK281 TaxID=1881067 RepID=UPI001587E7B0|nr:hypothetical protein [Sphingomonas sp. OK281]
MAAFFGLWSMLWFAPKTPIGRMLSHWMVEWPADRLNRVSRANLVMLAGGLLLVSVLLWLEAGDALRVLGMAGPETLGWVLTFEISCFADILAVATLAWSSWSGGEAKLPPSKVIRRARAGCRRMRRTRSTKATKGPAASDDDPYVLSCAA